jgi:hypothetical protein
LNNVKQSAAKTIQIYNDVKDELNKCIEENNRLQLEIANKTKTYEKLRIDRHRTMKSVASFKSMSLNSSSFTLGSSRRQSVVSARKRDSFIRSGGGGGLDEGELPPIADVSVISDSTASIERVSFVLAPQLPPTDRGEINETEEMDPLDLEGLIADRTATKQFPPAEVYIMQKKEGYELAEALRNYRRKLEILDLTVQNTRKTNRVKKT